MTRPARSFRLPLAAAGLALAAIAPVTASAGLADIDVGDPSVLSQRGQRLKLAVPYGSAPGERVSASRFEVVSVKAPDGFVAPDPARFTIAKPPRRNFVYLESSDPVDAPELSVTVRVSGDQGSTQTWLLAVPPARGASMVPVSAPAAVATDAERRARRGPTRARTAAR